jgi:GT2 family glycosyltransferase/glycosyltransferase involved in cell wall biosynthesis
LPEYLIDGHPHVYVFSVRSGEKISRTDATVLSYPKYSLSIDVADSSTISGWLYRHDKASQIQLCMRSSDYPEQHTSTNISRLDVCCAHINAHEHTGFEFRLMEKQVYQGTVFNLYDVETGIDIANIAISMPYESLTSLAIELAKLPTSSFAKRNDLSQALMRSEGLASYSVKLLPKVVHKTCPQQVDIIIPIYGGAVETVECLESVLASKNNILTRIIVINDCTLDRDIRNYLELLEKRERNDLIILHRTENGGFSEAVNIGMIAAGDHDVILLNADTVVQSGWIDRIIGVSGTDSRIGTITPFSNNAEICTLPYICKSLPVLDPDLAAEIDNVASSVNAGKIVDIPVAIGFCMYIRRECINEVGFFDAATWGRGYGEEVDFCLKASALGWRHVMACDTFVVHRGNVSFGDEKLERVKVSAKKISERYPFYDHVIQRFLAMDPASKLRRTINIKLINNALPANRILHITHNFGGGTEQYIKDMVILNKEAGHIPFILRFSSTGEASLSTELSGTRLVGLFADHHDEKYTRFETKTILEDIAKLGITKLHIHSPIGISIEFIDFVTANYNFDVTVHDYSWICPRVSLTISNGVYCREPEVKKCSECVKFNKPHPGLQHFVIDAKENIADYRVFFSKLFSRAEKVSCGAKDVVERMQHHGIEGKYIAAAHPVTDGSVFSQTQNLENKWDGRGKISVAMFGGISDIKGFHVLLECAEHVFKKNLPIQFILFGHTMNDDLCRAHSSIKILGRYKEDSLSELVERYRPHLSFFPNQSPETFSYTLSHSLRLGIWPLVSDIGAPAERIRQCEFGAVYPFTLNASEICNFIIEQAILQSSTLKLVTI